MIRLPRLLTTLASIAVWAARGNAQGPATIGNVAHPRVAVVLSGGSAKGLAEIGALQVIEELGIPIDVVTGTSMGAIIGGLYAAGYSPANLARLVDAEDWNEFFKKPTDRRLQKLYERLEDERFTITFPLERARPQLPAGAISRQSIAEHLERYLWPVHDVTDFMQLPTPFGALVTDLRTGDAVLLHSGSLAQAIEGSAAVPGVFAPLTLADGRPVVDGAVNRNIPAEDARALGADILICVDVSERILPVDKLHSLIDVVDQTVAFRVQMSNAVERPLCSVVIEPEISGLSSADFALGDQWVARGRTAALAQQPELKAIADSVRRRRGHVAPRREIPAPDSVFIRHVSWSKVSDGATAIAQGAITLPDSAWVTLQTVDAAVARAFASGRFDQVSYRVVSRANGVHDLVFDLSERDRDILGVGIRYDTPRGVALLGTARVADVLSPGSTASIGARLGQIQQFDARDVLGEGFNARFVQTYRVTLTRVPLPTLSVHGATDPPVLDLHEVGAAFEHALVGGLAVQLGATREWSRDGATDATGLFAPRSQQATVVSATIIGDTRDAIAFPTKGGVLFGRSEISAPTLGGGGTFARQTLDAQGAMPVFPGVSLLGSVRVGRATGADLPMHDLFFLGGGVPSTVFASQFVPFWGMDPQSVAGRSVRVLQAGVQAHVPDGLIVSLRGNLGNVFDPWPGSTTGSGYKTGLGLTVSSMFAPGPLTLSFGTRSWHQTPIVELAFGTSF